MEDHAALRGGLRALIEALPQWRVCGEADNVPRALDTAKQQQPDLAVVDLSLGSGNGLDLTKKLKELLPKLRVLMLSMHSEEMHAEHALRAGASGYLMKHDLSDHLVEALQAILRGEVWLSETLRGKVR